MQRLDIGRMRLTSTTRSFEKPGPSVPRHRRGELFVQGPVPWTWLTAAARLPGRALHVGIVLWLESGLRKSAIVSLSQRRLRDLGVERHAGYRGLSSLEEAGLVDVQRHRGRLSVVTFRDRLPGGGYSVTRYTANETDD